MARSPQWNAKNSRAERTVYDEEPGTRGRRVHGLRRLEALAARLASDPLMITDTGATDVHRERQHMSVRSGTIDAGTPCST